VSLHKLNLCKFSSYQGGSNRDPVIKYAIYVSRTHVDILVKSRMQFSL